MTEPLRLLKSTILRFVGAIFFLLTSLYFFLAYPYTNFFLIQAPPYPWLTWFANHDSLLYWAALVLTFIEFYDCRQRFVFRIAFILQIAMGIGLTLSGLQKACCDWKAYAWSLAILVPFWSDSPSPTGKSFYAKK